MKKHSGITAVIALACIIVPSVLLMKPDGSPDAMKAAAVITEVRNANTLSEKEKAKTDYAALTKHQKSYIPSAVTDRL